MQTSCPTSRALPTSRCFYRFRVVSEDMGVAAEQIVAFLHVWSLTSDDREYETLVVSSVALHLYKRADINSASLPICTIPSARLATKARNLPVFRASPFRISSRRHAPPRPSGQSNNDVAGCCALLHETVAHCAVSMRGIVLSYCASLSPVSVVHTATLFFLLFTSFPSTADGVVVACPLLSPTSSRWSKFPTNYMENVCPQVKFSSNYAVTNRANYLSIKLQHTSEIIFQQFV